MNEITIRNAYTHNLKHIDLTIPRDKFCVITGLSGSGKSSLAFNTLYAEGQRRYVESLSAYARQFLQLMEKPNVDEIQGLSPAISIDQKSTSHNPRSTVGTVTEVYDYLRLLYARIGHAYCPQHNIELKVSTVSQMVDTTLDQEEGKRFMILAPVVRRRKGQYLELIQKFIKNGFVRFRIDGVIYNFDEMPELNPKQYHTIEIIVDRFKIRPDIQQRLAQSYELALQHAEGLALLVPMDDHDPEEEVLFSSQYSCPHCGFTLSELEPRDFSFNSPHGACPHCSGLGCIFNFTPQSILSSAAESIFSGCFAFLKSTMFQDLSKEVDKACAQQKISLTTPFMDLSEDAQNFLFYGSKTSDFPGLLQRCNEIVNNPKEKEMRRQTMRSYMDSVVCPECHGQRLNLSYRNVLVGGISLPSLCHLSIVKALDFFASLTLSPQENAIASRILVEISKRLTFLKNVGLSYLTLDRAANTLSGGEAQRIRLASQIGSSLVGVMYVLDEPSIGLHQSDNQRLIDSLKHLRDQGNTIIVVEHDEDTIRQSDHIIDIGPFAGVHGGEIVAQGDLRAIEQCERSLTGAYLSGRLAIPVPKTRHQPESETDYLCFSKCYGNNLKHISVKIPLGCLTVVTGVSGSGKSTLVNKVIAPKVDFSYYNDGTNPYGCIADTRNFWKINKVIRIDQKPIGKTSRSNPATYIGVSSDIRKLFSMTTEAQARGYAPGRFSFNVVGGRCEACKGEGSITVAMHFLPDVHVECDVCHGARFNRETLEITYKNKNIADVFNMTVEDACVFFKNIPSIYNKLRVLLNIGLGYLTLGQSSTTLSGGEAQRIKLAKELIHGQCFSASSRHNMYILDEPTTGLHFYDVHQLLETINFLRDQGHTIVVIEHNLDFIKCADYIIDLGPEGGENGGRIIATGTPEEICKVKASATGKYLKPVLEHHKKLSKSKKTSFVRPHPSWEQNANFELTTL